MDKTIKLLRLLRLTAVWAPIIFATGAAFSSELRFQGGENGEFTFDTGVLRGKLRPGGKSAGLSSVIYLPTGTRVDASMGLFSYYRLFSANHRYGTAAWDWPSEARLTDDGDAEVTWPAAPDRAFELRGIYHWVTPDLLELHTEVKALTNLNRFEVFLASYFNSPFTNAAVRAADRATPKHVSFCTADRAFGDWQVFPRDDQAIGVIQDGRWKYEPNPVAWTVVKSLSIPLAFRRSPETGLTGVLMGSRKDCFAIFTPFQTEPHYSMYLSLFGRDLKPGQTAQARTRLWVGVNIPEEAMIKQQRNVK